MCPLTSPYGIIAPRATPQPRPVGKAVGFPFQQQPKNLPVRLQFPVRACRGRSSVAHIQQVDEREPRLSLVGVNDARRIDYRRRAGRRVRPGGRAIGLLDLRPATAGQQRTATQIALAVQSGHCLSVNGRLSRDLQEPTDFRQRLALRRRQTIDNHHNARPDEQQLPHATLNDLRR